MLSLYYKAPWELPPQVKYYDFANVISLVWLGQKYFLRNLSRSIKLLLLRIIIESTTQVM